MKIMTILVLLFFAVIWVAYANGANDNMKGVATLIGSGTATYRQGLVWATAATLLGSLMALYIGDELIKAFSGQGLVPAETIANPGFLLAVGVGAAATVLLATVLGFPISTTHSLIGGLVGAGLMSPAGSLNLAALGARYFLPLILSPFVAVALTYAVYWIFHRARVAMGVTRETCVCVGEAVAVVSTESAPGPAAVAMISTQPELRVGPMSDCQVRYAGSVVGLPAQKILDVCHYLSAGAVSFARGLNDTPKIIGLLVAAQALAVSKFVAIPLIGIAMAVGGILGARKVATTMSERITDMNSGQGFSGNLVTAILVIFASKFGMPVSTTHVSCGSIFGVGLASGTAKWKAIGGILLSWIITLPLAAAIAAGACFLVK